MSLKDIIAAKKLQTFIIPATIVEDIEEDISSYIITNRKEFSQEEKDLFFSLYAPYIREPYKFDWFIFRDYFSLFFPDGAFVINTFEKLDIELILTYYLAYKKPKNLEEYTTLCHFLNHISLMIPKEYEERITKGIYNN